MRSQDNGAMDEIVMKDYLLVDGYNIINAWPSLKEYAKDNLEEARIKLIELLRDYQGYRGINIIIVFDAHMTDSALRHSELYGKVKVIYTKKHETADHYIERWVGTNGKKCNVWVATSDFLEQTMVMSQGGIRMSARELYEEIIRLQRERDSRFINKQGGRSNILGDRLNSDILGKLEAWRRQR